MNECDFNLLANRALIQIEDSIDSYCSDVDFSCSGNILEIEFNNGHKIIINRHDVNQEIWIAAKTGGFHYFLNNGIWHSQRDNSELFSKLIELFAANGEQLTF